MSARFSERLGLARWLPRQARDERGAILVITALAMVVLLATGGLAVDMGQVYITRSKLSAVADAGALAGARIARLGQTRATTAVMNLAAANGVVTGADGANISVGFAKDAKGRQTVSVAVSRPQKLLFAGLLGYKEMPVRASATATGPPVDLVMILDQSGSLAEANAWDDVQRASKQFVGMFGDSYDKLSLVSFHTVAGIRHPLSFSFRSKIQGIIDGMQSHGSTNMAEGLRKAAQELASGRSQAGSLKAVIFFTDGWPTAYRDTIRGADNVNRDLIIGIYADGPRLESSEAIYFANPEDISMNRYTAPTGDCDWDSNRCPRSRISGRTAQVNARAAALARAHIIRESGAYLYTIGMKDIKSAAEPDMDFLREMANEEGVADYNQPQAKAYYAPSGAQLQEIFTKVAADIMVHLVQ